MPRQSMRSYENYSHQLRWLHEVSYSSGTDLHNNSSVGIEGMLWVWGFFIQMIRGIPELNSYTEARTHHNVLMLQKNVYRFHSAVCCARKAVFSHWQWFSTPVKYNFSTLNTYCADAKTSVIKCDSKYIQQLHLWIRLSRTHRTAHSVKH